MALGFFASILFAIAGGLLYAGTLSDRRQEFTLQQAKDILRLGIVETLLTQGKTLFELLGFGYECRWTCRADHFG